MTHLIQLTRGSKGYKREILLTRVGSSRTRTIVARRRKRREGGLKHCPLSTTRFVTYTHLLSMIFKKITTAQQKTKSKEDFHRWPQQCRERIRILNVTNELHKKWQMILRFIFGSLCTEIYLNRVQGILWIIIIRFHPRRVL